MYNPNIIPLNHFKITNEKITNKKRDCFLRQSLKVIMCGSFSYPDSLLQYSLVSYRDAITGYHDKTKPKSLIKLACKLMQKHDGFKYNG